MGFRRSRAHFRVYIKSSDVLSRLGPHSKLLPLDLLPPDRILSHWDSLDSVLAKLGLGFLYLKKPLKLNKTGQAT